MRAPEGKAEATVEIGAGEHRSGIEITLEPSAQLEGRLVDRDGQPLGGWFAVARSPDASPDSPDGWVRIAETSRDGTFAIRDVDPGSVGFAVVDGSESLKDAPGPVSTLTSAPELRRITIARGETIELGDVVVDPLE
ncbi:MAG: hypothetical protein IAG13_33020 [Deltaproteobacteria bacterium]|nr:hypothetical protein [Nannocystaceae bacterium]